MPISFSEDENIIIEKIQSYCLYQERCVKEVKNKLYSFKVSSQLAKNIVEYLIDNDYLIIENPIEKIKLKMHNKG